MPVIHWPKRTSLHGEQGRDFGRKQVAEAIYQQPRRIKLETGRVSRILEPSIKDERSMVGDHSGLSFEHIKREQSIPVWTNEDTIKD